MHPQGTVLPLHHDSGLFVVRNGYLRHPLRTCTSLAGPSSPRKRFLQSGRTRIVRRTPPITLWKCELDVDNSDGETSSRTEKAIDQTESVPSGPTETRSNGSGSNTGTMNFMAGPSKSTNRIIALISATAAIGLFLISRGGFTGATLGELAASAIPYEEALSNGRPTVLEFYADWCEVCREMAPDVYKVEQQYKGFVNFVMLNVDNSKWDQEFDEFGVEGIPHFTFLDQKGNEEGNIVGRLPKKYLEDNVAALAKGEETVPHTRLVGKFSNADLHQSPPVVEPRSHGF